MKKYAVVAALVLAACGENAAQEPAAEEEMAAEEIAVQEPAAETVMAADGMPAPGTYEVTLANGEVWTETLNPDGTYTSAGPNGETESGTWTQESPERYCTTVDGETEPTCYSESMSADGVWTSTEEGTDETSTVVRVG